MFLNIGAQEALAICQFICPVLVICLSSLRRKGPARTQRPPRSRARRRQAAPISGPTAAALGADGCPAPGATANKRARTHTHTHTHTHTRTHTAVSRGRGAQAQYGQPGPKVHPRRSSPMHAPGCRPASWVAARTPATRATTFLHPGALRVSKRAWAHAYPRDLVGTGSEHLPPLRGRERPRASIAGQGDARSTRDRARLGCQGGRRGAARGRCGGGEGRRRGTLRTPRGGGGLNSTGTHLHHTQRSTRGLYQQAPKRQHKSASGKSSWSVSFCHEIFTAARS